MVGVAEKFLYFANYYFKYTSPSQGLDGTLRIQTEDWAPLLPVIDTTQGFC